MAKRIRFSAKVRGKIWRKCGGRCAYCGADLRYSKWTIDHIRPLVKGGSNKTPNLLVACEACNKAKGAMSMAQFRRWVAKYKPAWFDRHDGVFYLDRKKRARWEGIRRQPGWRARVVEGIRHLWHKFWRGSR